ncbi:hypothetical protein L6E12_20995 [Actinokineospora sp. PR83]|uniref:hypothetical protein n=1 Tax=Actinokineospora sp. PR83 TaxID=2884908 RepID=UPI001F36EE89|nr:hypothetical protein [Actinokineospora sp. PR83]MCG8918264.1 hypothetical protein [Actinokineospora sp. PR83]
MPPEKRGPKPKYCTDGKTWPPDGRTCKEMAQIERDAAAAVGLEVPLATYQQATERLAPSLAEVRDRLDTLLAAGADLDSAALTRVAAAEEERGEALQRAEAAEAQAAVDQRKRADAERAARLDREARLVAERLARDAEKEKQEQVGAAWVKVVEAERAQGQAEGQRDEAKANLRAYIARFDDLAGRHDELRKTHATTERDLTKATTALRAAEKTVEALSNEKTTLTGQVTDLRAAVEKAAVDQQAALEALREQMQQRVDALTAQAAAERSRADTAEAQLGALREQITDLREQNTTLAKQLGGVEPEVIELRRQLAEATKPNENP